MSCMSLVRHPWQVPGERRFRRYPQAPKGLKYLSPSPPQDVMEGRWGEGEGGGGGISGAMFLGLGDHA